MIRQRSEKQAKRANGKQELATTWSASREPLWSRLELLSSHDEKQAHRLGELSKSIDSLNERLAAVERWLEESDIRFDEVRSAAEARAEGTVARANKPDELTSLFVRVLLASDQGQRFQPVIDEAIQKYRGLRESLNRLSRFEDQTHEAVLESRAIIEPELSDQTVKLETLGVTITEVEPGSIFETGRHRVVEPLETANPESVNTVQRCLQPEFRWKSLDGEDFSRHAEVTAYVRLR